MKDVFIRIRKIPDITGFATSDKNGLIESQPIHTCSVITMKIGENLRSSISFAHDALFGRWIRWIMLVIGSFVFPIMYGYTVRIMRGIEPAYEEE